MNNIQFYLNLPQPRTTIIKNPPRKEFLERNNNLKDVLNKKEALSNLGITTKLEELKTLIQNKIIEAGGVIFDLEPTIGNTDHVLSSDAIKKALKKFPTKLELEDSIRESWSQLVRIWNEKIEEILLEIDEISSNPEVPENCASQEDLDRVIDRLTILENGPYSFIVDGIKHIIIKKSLYNKLTEYDNNALYFVTKDWTFGEEFPIVFTDAIWMFGKQFPVSLT